MAGGVRAAIAAMSSGLVLAGCGMAVDESIATEKHRIQVTTVAEGLAYPWGLDFLPDGRMIVSERPGRLRLVSADGTVAAPIAGVPLVDARGQGGMLDVALHPDFASNRLVYFSFSERDGALNGTSVARARLSAGGDALENLEVIFRQEPKVDSTLHFGSRLVFDGKGHLFVTLGERFDEEFRQQAQDVGSLFGKVVRLNEDGSIPQDNPFVGVAGARPEIWSYGHRNAQGAALHPVTGELWEAEHGPEGGDEINIARRGANYGWPLVSFGVNYDGTPVGDGGQRMEGVVDPILVWTPVIAVSGIAFYSGDAFPEWRGNLFAAGLRATTLVRVELDGETVTHEERLLEAFGERIRDVNVAPDGTLYVLTDEGNGQILRIAPAR